MKDVDTLTSGWLRDVSEPFRDRLLSLGRWHTVPRGTVIFGQGADEQDLFGIASGSIRMHIAMNEHEHRVAHICGPGFWVGEHEFITGTPRIIEMEAPEDTTLMRFRRSDFAQLLKDVPDAWRWIALLAAQHLAVAIGAADDLMLPLAEKRMAAVLLRLCARRLAHPASPAVDRILMSQSELASAANLSRASAGRILRDFAKAGAIATNYGSIDILDPEALAAKLP